MPLNQCANGRGWRWGAKGKCFVGKDAKKKAIKQALAEGGGKMPVEKADDTIPLWKCEAQITKIDEDKQMVFGWASVAITKNGEVVVDCQDDIIDPQALENAAYEFALNFSSNAVNVEHAGPAVGRLVESFVVTAQKLDMMGLEKTALPTAWWIGFKIDDDEVWKNVKNKNYRAFSIEGVGKREKIND